MANFDDKTVRGQIIDPKGQLQANLPAATAAQKDPHLGAGMGGVLKTVQTEFADLRKKANVQLNASIAGAIKEVHKFMGTGSYIKDELSQLSSELDETKDLISEQVALGEHQQKLAISSLSRAADENDLVGESVVTGVQANEAAKNLKNIPPDQRSARLKDTVAQYDSAVQQLRNYVS